MALSVHLLFSRYDEDWLARLRRLLPADVQLTTGSDLPQPADYHILVAGRPTRAQIEASPNLRALVVPWAGIPESTRELMLDYPGIAVHNLHHNAAPVAELVLALLLAAAKFIVPFDRSLRAHDWTPRYQPSPAPLLAGQTALVLGYGAIGQRVARLCRGLGMEVIASRRRASMPPHRDEHGVLIAPAAALHELLPQAAALLICLPHTPETTGLIGARELKLLPPHAVLVNIARGPVVDEAALYHALRERSILAAGLDVWYHYPADEAARSHTPPSNYAFHELDNVVMSPHRGGASTATERLRMEHLATMLNAAAQGEPLPNRVDLEAGY